MKIGVFTDSYLPYTSGVVRSVQSFKEALQRFGHEVFIFAPSYRNCPGDEDNIFRFASIPSPTNRDFTLAVPFSLRLKPTIEKLKLDIIHVHSPFLLGRLGARYSKRLRLPLVFTFHTLYDQYVHYVPFAQSFTKELAQRISKDFCNQCDLVLVPTRVIGSYLRQIGVRTAVQCVPTGIDTASFTRGNREWMRKKHGIPPADRVLLFVGRLGQEKNVGFLLDCFARVNTVFPDTWLVLVGGGPEEENLKKAARELGVAARTVFTGTLPPGEVVHHYAGSDLFVFSSVTETQGIVIAEAKAAGLPVVAVNAFGVAEMVAEGEDGYLTPPGREHFTEKIMFLLENEPVRRNMALKAKANAEELSLENCTRRLIRCYEDLIAEKTKKQAAP
ncbi:MAG: glycosyltransferase family 4 protein [Firmicutes bacterium]|nr:glycosyltransferase family 4 protein [Bacillota bacterium]